MRVIHVLRKPCSEGTVAANTLKHGTGGLNIDASRVGGGADNGVWPITDRQGRRSFNAAEDGSLNNPVETNTSTGRWPANVILQHLDGCRCVGTKRVKACGVGSVKRSTGKENGGQTGASYGAESRPAGTEMINYADADGKETVANWVCEPGCPVKTLDEQTGTLKSGWRPNRKSGSLTNPGQKGRIYNTGMGGRLSQTHNDSGGASRFYKQVGGKVSE